LAEAEVTTLLARGREVFSPLVSCKKREKILPSLSLAILLLHPPQIITLLYIPHNQNRRHEATIISGAKYVEKMLVNLCV